MLSTTPVRVALPATALATFLEMVSVYNLDNLLIPVGMAVFIKLMGGALF
jgi:dolichol kinase